MRVDLRDHGSPDGTLSRLYGITSLKRVRDLCVNRVFFMMKMLISFKLSGSVDEQE
jgi:hypothetical protein